MLKNVNPVVAVLCLSCFETPARVGLNGPTLWPWRPAVGLFVMEISFIVGNYLHLSSSEWPTAVSAQRRGLEEVNAAAMGVGGIQKVGGTFQRGIWGSPPRNFFFGLDAIS